MALSGGAFRGTIGFNETSKRYGGAAVDRALET